MAGKISAGENIYYCLSWVLGLKDLTQKGTRGKMSLFKDE